MVFPAAFLGGFLRQKLAQKLHFLNINLDPYKKKTRYRLEKETPSHLPALQLFSTN